MKSECYTELSKRIKAASGNTERLKRLEVSSERIYNAGLISAQEFAILDGMIFGRICKISADR